MERILWNILLPKKNVATIVVKGPIKSLTGNEDIHDPVGADPLKSLSQIRKGYTMAMGGRGYQENVGLQGS